jgi:hypothetical protein
VFRAELTVWVWPGKHRATKLYSSKGGVLVKESPSFLDGLAQTVVRSVSDIARMSVLEDERSAVLLYAIAGNGARKYVLASLKSAERAGWQASRLFPKVADDIPVLVRSAAAFVRPAGRPGYMLIDCDLRGRPLETILDWLFQICPELRLAPIAAFPSGSGFVALEGQAPTPAGWHIVVGIQDASDATRALGILFERCFLIPGAHWAEVSEAGGIIPKAIVDRALRNPVQPHFIQPPVIGPGVIRKAPVPVVLNPDAPGLDTRAAVHDLNPDELARIAAARTLAEISVEGVAMGVRERRAQKKAQEAVDEGRAPDLATALEAARAAVAAEARGILDWGTALHFDRFGWVLPAEIFEYPSKYDGATLADPVEPNYGGVGGRPGRNKAVIRIRGNQAIITTLAHSSGAKGRNFILDADLQAFMAGGFPEGPTDAADPGVGFNGHEPNFRTFSEAELAEKGIKGARGLAQGDAFTHDGLPDFDMDAAVPVLTTRRRTLLALAEQPPREASKGMSVGLLINRALANGAEARAMVYGDANAALAEAIGAATGGDVTTRVDLYTDREPPVSGAFPIVPRSRGCLKPRALKAVQDHAPRSVASLICKTATVECPHFNDCPVIASYLDAQRHSLVQYPAFSARVDLNALINETAGPVGVFMDPRTAVDVVSIPVADFPASGTLREAAIALLDPTKAPREALLAVRPSTLDALDALAKDHGIAATPATPEEDVVLAVERARAARPPDSVAPHIIASVLADFYRGYRDVLVKRNDRRGPVVSFVDAPGLRRAAHHQVAIAFNPMPLEAVDVAAASQAVFRAPSIAIPGAAPQIGPIIQAFDAKADVFDSPAHRVDAAINLGLALQGAGLRAAVITSISTTGARGLEIRSPKDRIGDAIDVAIWADPLTASDIDVARLLKLSGLDAKPFTFENAKVMRWTTRTGKVLAAAGFRPSDDDVFRAWKVAAWRPVLEALSGRRCAVVVLSDVACPLPVHALVGTDDLTLPNAPRGVHLAARLMGLRSGAEVMAAADEIAQRMGVALDEEARHSVRDLTKLSAARLTGTERVVEALSAIMASSAPCS